MAAQAYLGSFCQNGPDAMPDFTLEVVQFKVVNGRANREGRGHGPGVGFLPISRGQRREETSMTIYISQGRYTAAAIKGMSARPEDRSEAVAELFAAAGGRLISWYLTLGRYDWLIIAEAPDERTMISAVLAAAA